MLIAVLSDIHANLPALEAVLSDAATHHPDSYIVAGDLSGGPQPGETLEALRTVRSKVIRGNGEGYLIRLWRGDAPVEWQQHRRFGFRRWCAKQVGDQDRVFVYGLPEEMSIDLPSRAAIRVVHGSPGSPSEGIYPQHDGRTALDALTRVNEPVLICGHTHEQWQLQFDGRLILNPGAVGGPCDGTIGAQYALLRWDGERWQAELKQVDYTVAEVRRAFQDSGLLEAGGAFARAVLAGMETGIDVPRALLKHADGFMQAQRDKFATDDDIWESACDCFDWQRYERGAQ